jgi:type II secretory pathway component PulC
MKLIYKITVLSIALISESCGHSPSNYYQVAKEVQQYEESIYPITLSVDERKTLTVKLLEDKRLKEKKEEGEFFNPFESIIDVLNGR